MVTLPAVEGQIGIFPHHVPLLTRIVPGEIMVRKDAHDDFLALGDGLVEITSGRVAIVTDMAVAAKDIDEASQKKRASAPRPGCASSESGGSKRIVTPEVFRRPWSEGSKTPSMSRGRSSPRTDPTVLAGSATPRSVNRYLRSRKLITPSTRLPPRLEPDVAGETAIVATGASSARADKVSRSASRTAFAINRPRSRQTPACTRDLRVGLFGRLDESRTGTLLSDPPTVAAVRLRRHRVDRRDQDDQRSRCDLVALGRVGQCRAPLADVVGRLAERIDPPAPSALHGW